MQQGSEQLHVGAILDIGNIDDRGGEERQVVARADQVLDRLAAMAEQIEEAFGQPVSRLVVNHRAHERGGFIKRCADDHPVRQPLHFGHRRVIHAGLDDQPPSRAAALPGAGKGGLDHQRGGIGQLGGIPQHDRIVAAHFERDDLVRAGGKLAVDRDPGVGGAGEQDAVDPFVRDQRLPFRRTADQQLDHARCDPGAVKALHQQFGSGGGLFAGLEHDRIARDQRGNDVAVGQMRWKIVGAQHRHHPVRFVP